MRWRWLLQSWIAASIVLAHVGWTHLVVAESPEASIDMEPKPGWRDPMATDVSACKELYTLLRPKTKPDASLTVKEPVEMLPGVCFMMPLQDVVNQMGLGTTLLPARSPIVHPGIPFYFRPFSTSKIGKQIDVGGGSSDIGSPEHAHWDLVYIITDNKDMVVSILLVALAPKKPVVSPVDTDFLFFNHPLSKRRASTITDVSVKVDGSEGVIEIASSHIATGGRSNYSVGGASGRRRTLEESRWFVPTRLAEFLCHVLEIKLRIVKDSSLEPLGSKSG